MGRKEADKPTHSLSQVERVDGLGATGLQVSWGWFGESAALNRVVSPRSQPGPEEPPGNLRWAGSPHPRYQESTHKPCPPQRVGHSGWRSWQMCRSRGWPVGAETLLGQALAMGIAAWLAGDGQGT